MGRRCRRISPPQLALLPACQKGRENRPFNPFTINAEIRRFHRVERCGLWHELFRPVNQCVSSSHLRVFSPHKFDSLRRDSGFRKFLQIPLLSPRVSFVCWTQGLHS
jgi:hypothetical protein